ncbi:hypothetical protein D3C85_1547190 [compost metagenome]
MPHTPKVWPKSESWRGIPAMPETSIKPTTPTVVLSAKRPRVLTERIGLPCNRSLIKTLGSPKFATKLCTPVWKKSGK